MSATIVDSTIHPPSSFDSVFKDECLFSFQTPESEGGINICLYCYQAFAPLDAINDTNYTFFHYANTGHAKYLNIKKNFLKEQQEQQIQKKLKLDRVQILQENEDEFYESKYQLVLVDEEKTIPLTIFQTAEGYEIVEPDLPSNISATILAILNATSVNLKNDIQSWEQEIKPCPHSKNLVSQAAPDYVLGAKCSQCDLHENLWICLHCGSLGCGRHQFGGLSGNSHALSHYEDFHHPVAVKLGSLSLKEGKADCFCYQCNDEVKVPNLASDLKKFGIDASSFEEKNEKTLTELNIQKNLSWQFNMESEGGELFEPIFGKGLVGLKNLGNSCYINSNVQLLAHVKSFVHLFYGKDVFNFDSKALEKSYDDLYLQLFKIFNGLVSDSYSKPNLESADAVKWQKGLSLAIFKALVGKSNQDFNSPEQQDAFEFLLFLLDQVETYYYKNKAKYPDSSAFKENPVKSFKFVVHDKLTLENSKRFKVRDDLNQYLSVNVDEELIYTDEDGKKHYKPVDINDAVSDFFNAKEEIELGNKNYTKQSLLASLPDILLIQVQRAKLVNWTPTKVDVPVKIPDEKINLKPYLVTKSERLDDANSLQLLPEEKEEPQKAEYEFNPTVLDNLLQMGFSEVRAKRALYNVNNSSNPDDAMNWLFAHMEDPDIDEPLVNAAPKTNPSEPSQMEIDNLVSMGFAFKLARKALMVSGKNTEAAVEWLFNNADDNGEIEDTSTSTAGVPSVKEQVDEILESHPVTDNITLADADYFLKAVICHKGNSIHTGHYVIFIKDLYNEKVQWILFNDEKVVLANDSKSLQEIEKNGYLYLFVRKGSENDDIGDLFR